MDTDAVDRWYSALQQQVQQNAALLQALATKLSAAAATGDPNARQWQLDLKEITLAIRDQEIVATSLLQAIHTLVDSHAQRTAPPIPQDQQANLVQAPSRSTSRRPTIVIVTADPPPAGRE